MLAVNKKTGKAKYGKNRYFMFCWSEANDLKDEWHNLIIAPDAQAATDLFMAQFGNLKKNEIHYIQEVTADGKEIGQPIIPESQEQSITDEVNENLKTMMGFRRKKSKRYLNN